MSRKRQRGMTTTTTTTATTSTSSTWMSDRTSICNWTNDLDTANGTTLSTTKQQQLTINSFFVTGSRRIRHKPLSKPSSSCPPPITTSGLATPPCRPSTNKNAVKTPPTIPFSSNKKLDTPPIRCHSKTKQLKQVYLDCGQSEFGQQLCSKCGMLYMPGIKQDMKAHAEICRQRCSGVLWRGGQRILWQDGKDNTIISLPLRGSKTNVGNRKKPTPSISSSLESVYQHVIQDLGMDPNVTTSQSLVGHTVWLYLRQQRVVGMVATKPIQQAFRLLTADNEKLSDAETKEQHGDEEENNKNKSNSTAIDCLFSTNVRTPARAMLGIAILWTHENFRGQAIASRLLNVARQHAFFGMTVPISQIAFSSPTQAGWTFAKKYCGDDEEPDPLIYEYKRVG